jgi:hypothetical protein
MGFEREKDPADYAKQETQQPFDRAKSESLSP